MKKTVKIIALAMVALMLMLALVSCGAKPNEDPDAAKKALEENGYTVVKLPISDEIFITAYKGDDSIDITYYKDEAAAEEAYEEAKEEFNEMKDEAEELFEDFNLEIGQSGNMIWVGTPDAIKAAS